MSWYNPIDAANWVVDNTVGKLTGTNPIDTGRTEAIYGDYDKLRKQFLTEYENQKPTQYRTVKAPSFGGMELERGRVGSSLEGLGSLAASGAPGENAATIARQSAALGGMEQAAAGAVPSAAEMQMRRGLDQAMANQLALAARARGGQTSLALRSAADNVAGMQSQGTLQAAELRAAEQARAREALVQAMQGVRSQEGALRLDRFGRSVDAANRYADQAGQAFRDVGQLDLGRAGLTMRGEEANQGAGLRASALDAEREQAMRQALFASLGGMGQQTQDLYAVQAGNQSNRQKLLDAASQLLMKRALFNPSGGTAGGSAGGGAPMMPSASGGATSSMYGAMIPGIDVMV